MLKKIRVALAIISILALTFCFLDFTGVAHQWFGWLPKIQFLPAVLALNLAVVLGLIVLTLILGRVYCSVICPLGIMQDFFTWLRGKFKINKKKKNRFFYAPEKRWIRIGVLAIFVITLAVPATHFLATLIAPYSAYGRIVNSLLAPVYDCANNMLADYSEAHDSYTFYQVSAVQVPAILRWIAVATLVLVGGTAFLAGRAYCNTVCPVGTILGYLSKFSLLKPYIDVSKCNGCTKCARNCKAECIDPKAHRIDYSRCVACMDCLDNCSTSAIRYGIPKKIVKNTESESRTPDAGRRAMIVGGLVVAGSSVAKAASEKLTDGGFSKLVTKEVPQGRKQVTPPGSLSVRNFRDHCTSCQLCIAACPNNVLRPSTKLDTLMQPEMEFEQGYCRIECSKCSNVCPAGAIRPISPEERTAISVGVAKVDRYTCLSSSQGVQCGNCARHCPAEALVMPEIAGDDGKKVFLPVVNEGRCIGCGACENLCPVNPISAIIVEGREIHKTV